MSSNTPFNLIFNLYIIGFHKKETVLESFTEENKDRQGTDVEFARVVVSEETIVHH